MKKSRSDEENLTENVAPIAGATDAQSYGATPTASKEKKTFASGLAGINRNLGKLEAAASYNFLPRRYYVGMMAFFGFANIYGMRVNLSIAILEMTKNRTVYQNGTTRSLGGEFAHWDSVTQGLILSSFFYGYVITQLPGGWMAAKWGGRNLYGGGILGTALLTLLTPPIAHMGTWLLVIVRICEGLFEGVTYPSIHAMWRVWAPPMEKTKLATIAFAGSYFGTVVSMPLSAWLGEKFGWPAIFYVFGLLALVWCSVWFKTVRESPGADPQISELERDYIEKSIGFTHEQVIMSVRKKSRRKKQPDFIYARKNKRRKEKDDDPDPVGLGTPWRAMLTSPPVWAISAAHFAENWGFYTMITHLPQFMEDVLKFKIQTSGILSALPYLLMGTVVISGGQLADYLRKKRNCDTGRVRKIFCCGAFLCQTCFIILTAHSANPTMAVICITLAVGLGGFAWSGFSVNPLDIAPQYASILMGLSNTIATLPGMISPAIAGAILADRTAGEWRLVFYIAAIIYAIGAALYFLWASGDKQPWAELQPTQHGGQMAEIGAGEEATAPAPHQID